MYLNLTSSRSDVISQVWTAHLLLPSVLPHRPPSPLLLLIHLSPPPVTDTAAAFLIITVIINIAPVRSVSPPLKATPP